MTYTEAQGRYQQGLASYRESRHDLALADLNAAIASGQLRSAETLNARKHVAFINCAGNRELPCREQFRKLFAMHPGFELLPSEAGHPSWANIYRTEKAAGTALNK